MVEERTSRRSVVVVDGRSLEHRLIGGETTPTLVFLHEGLGSMDLWREYPGEVVTATGRSGLVYSREGHGWSDPVRAPRAADFMEHEALTVLPQVLDRLEISDPILVGHSDGASIALIHAGAGHQVTGLVLLAPHVFVEPESIAGIEAALERFETTDLAERMRRYHRDPRSTFHAWNDVWLDPSFRAWNIEGYLPGIDCPTLLIQGRDDEYGTLAQLDAIERGVTGQVSRLVLDDCGHSPHLAQPARVLEATARFIEEIGEDCR
ncbi:MAG TPA: alpha/beta hydrolase [Acidimicrobiia bacterium]|nr:alpha/beta hydrolase [Acidimicrobiia bacterium]